jgi:hypothetical protein
VPSEHKAYCSYGMISGKLTDVVGGKYKYRVAQKSLEAPDNLRIECQGSLGHPVQLIDRICVLCLVRTATSMFTREFS